jgi:asparagine synthetase B (glutamine-hydrolysing)
MCGIGGIIVHGDGTTVQASELQAIGDAQRHRGPDDE